MMAGGLLFLVIGGMWVLNWLAVVLLTGALGLRRRRWGTPGGGWALASSALHAVAAVGLVVWIAADVVFTGAFNGAGEVVVLGIIFSLLALLLASHAALARALWLAWEAADVAAARSTNAADAAPIGSEP